VTLPDVHLAEEALAAYVDGVLAPSARCRAERHLRACPECRAAMEAEREAKVLILAAPDPELPGGLLARLLEVPMTADLGGGELVLAVDGDQLGWAAAERVAAPTEPRVVERSRTVTAPVVAPVVRRPSVAGRPAGPSGPGRPGRSPSPFAASASRLRRGRRGLAVSLAGLAFGMIASAASTTAPGSAAPARPSGVPGSPPTQLVVGGSNVPMEPGTFRFTRPDQAALVASRSDAR
jgi:putative zinc finger protein